MGIYIDDNNLNELLKQIDVLKTEIIKAENDNTGQVQSRVIECQVNGIRKIYEHIGLYWDFDTARMFKNLFEKIRFYGNLFED